MWCLNCPAAAPIAACNTDPELLLVWGNLRSVPGVGGSWTEPRDMKVLKQLRNKGATAFPSQGVFAEGSPVQVVAMCILSFAGRTPVFLERPVFCC